MGIFSESESEKAIREHNQGQKDGSQADFWDKIAHRIGGNPGCSDAYNAGWDNGVDNPASDDDDDDDDEY